MDETMRAVETPRVIVVGTGFGGLEAAFYLRKRLGKRIELTVVGDVAEFHFKPNTIYIPFGKPPEAFVFPLGPVFARRNIPFVEGRVHRVDPAAKQVFAGDRRPG